jgi:hypothetical protein
MPGAAPRGCGGHPRRLRHRRGTPGVWRFPWSAPDPRGRPAALGPSRLPGLVYQGAPAGRRSHANTAAGRARAPISATGSPPTTSRSASALPARPDPGHHRPTTPPGPPAARITAQRASAESLRQRLDTARAEITRLRAENHSLREQIARHIGLQRTGSQTQPSRGDPTTTSPHGPGDDMSTPTETPIYQALSADDSR